MKQNDTKQPIQFQPDEVEFPAVSDIRKRAMLEALKKSLGIVSAAARVTGINRDTHYAWVNSDPDYRYAVQSISDAAIDFAESKLFELIRGVTTVITDKDGNEQVVYKKEPNVTAIIFYLKTKAKHRGYVERVQLSAPGMEDIEVTLNLA